MSATGLDVFDKTLQTTNIWLNEISDAIGPDKQVAWKVLSTVLHKLRDRLPIEVSAHFGDAAAAADPRGLLSTNLSRVNSTSRATLPRSSRPRSPNG